MRSRFAAPVAMCLCLFVGGAELRAQQVIPLDLGSSHWIGAPPDLPRAETVALRKTFELPGEPAFAQALVTAEAAYELTINGTPVGRGDDWPTPERYDLGARLKVGPNVIGVLLRPGVDRAGLLFALRIVDRQGGLLDIVSDGSWRASAPPPEGWTDPAFDDREWPSAADLGVYGSPPWGRLTRLSPDESARAFEDIKFVLPAEPGGPSAFAGEYLRPEYAERYAHYPTIDRATGWFVVGGASRPLLFVRYAQPGPEPGTVITEPADFDPQLLEEDLALMAANGLNIALEGFAWPQLLDASGAWRRLPSGDDPAGGGLAREALDRVLDRIEAHGLYALALLDYREPLPPGTVPASYLDKALWVPQIWAGVLAGQTKIAAYYANRSVLVGYALAGDALPPWPSNDEPVVRAAWHGYLKERYGDVDGLRRAWGSSAAYRDLAEVAPPGSAPTDPAATDFGALRRDILTRRLDEWVDALRAAAPHHLLIYGEPVTSPARADLRRLHFDLLGAFGHHSPGTPAPAGASWPGYGALLADVAGCRALPDGPRGVIGGRLGVGVRGAQAGRLVRHEWMEVIGNGGAGLLAGPSWPLLANRGFGAGLYDQATIESLGQLVAATRSPMLVRGARALLVRNPAAALGNAPEPERRAVEAVADALDRAHVPYDMLPIDAIGAAGEPGRVDLGRYQAVLVPSLCQVPHDPFWTALAAWLQDDSSGRVAFLGRGDGLDSHFVHRLPEGLNELLGGVSFTAEAPAPDEAVVLLTPPLAPLPVGHRLPWPGGATSALTVGGEASIVGWLRSARTAPEEGTGVPVVARKAVGRNSLYVAGLDLAEVGPGAGDSLAGLVDAVLSDADVSPPVEAASNLSVYLSADGRTALVRERDGRSGDVLWAAPAAAPQVAWAGVTTTVDEHGAATVRGSVAPYQVAVLEALGEVHGVGSGQSAMIRAGSPAIQPMAVTVMGPDTMTVRLWLVPDRYYTAIVGDQTQPARQAGPDGGFDLPVDAPRPTVVKIAQVPIRAAADTVPADFLVVADYYLRRGEYGRALRELERLAELYPGSAVAALAAERREKLLADSGAVVFVNYTADPVDLHYRGPSEVEGRVGPGKHRTFLLHAGDYVEERLLPEGVQRIAGMPVIDSFSLTKGQVLLREWGIPLAGHPGEFDPRANLIPPLSEAQRQALLASAQGELPKPVAAAGEAAPQGLTGPELRIETSSDVRQKERTKSTKVIVRNLTDYPFTMTVSLSVPPNPAIEEKVELPPRGAYRTELPLQGVFSVFGNIRTNNQFVHLGVYDSDGNEYNLQLRELTERDLQQREREQEREQRRRGAARTRD